MPDDGRPAPLSILDLSPVVEGSTPAAALRNTLDLARRAEDLGYLRYWVAEHHLAPGVASSSPAVLITAIAAVTSRIRVGSGAVQLGHHTPAGVVEAFGTLSWLYPGRIDLGLGRLGQRRREEAVAAAAAAQASPAAPAPAASARTVHGLLIPAPFSIASLARSPRFALQHELLRQAGARTQDFGEQVLDILPFSAGRTAHRPVSPSRPCRRPAPTRRCGPWVLARVSPPRWPAPSDCRSRPTTTSAPRRCLRRWRLTARRSGRRRCSRRRRCRYPRTSWSRPPTARRGNWLPGTGCGSASSAPGKARCGTRRRRLPRPLRGVPRTGRWSAIALTPSSPARRRPGPSSVGSCQDATGADELLVTTITHSHADRVRSFELLAREWGLAYVVAIAGSSFSASPSRPAAR